MVIFSRFDCILGDDIIDIDFPGSIDIPPQELHLYHRGSSGLTDWHYDAMVASQKERILKSSRKKKHVKENEDLLLSGGGRQKRKTKCADVVDPHDEVPTFMRVIGRGCDECKDCKNSSPDDDQTPKDVPTELNIDAQNIFYEVSAMDDFDTPDELRKNLQESLDYLALLFRDYPTLPGNPADSVQEFPFANSKLSLIHI